MSLPTKLPKGKRVDGLCTHLDCHDNKCCNKYFMKRTGRMTKSGEYK